MNNHSRLDLRHLSWLVILLTVSFLAVGTITKAFADSPDMTGFSFFSGEIGIDPVATLGDPFISEFGVEPVQSAETPTSQTTYQLVILPVDPGASLPEFTGLPSDSPPYQMIMNPTITNTPQPVGEVDVSTPPGPDAEPVVVPENEVAPVAIINLGMPQPDLGEEASIPIQVVDFNFGTVDQELPQQGEVEVVVELEPVDIVQGDARQLDPPRGLQLEAEEPAAETKPQDGSGTPVEPEQPAADEPTQDGSDTPAELEQPPVPESDEHVVRAPTEIVELELSGVAPLYSTPPSVANGHNCDPAPVPEGPDQDDRQKAKRKQIADDLKKRGYLVTSGYGGGKGLVTGRKYDKGGHLVEEYKYEIDKEGNVTKETHRTIIRNKGVLKGETIETIERSGGKTVTTTENRDKNSLGRTTGGTKRVVTREPGKETKVEMSDWQRGKGCKGWVKRPEPDLGALPGDPPDIAEEQRDPQPEPKVDGPDRPDVPSVDPRRLPKDESKDEIPPRDEGCEPDGAKPCPLGCDAVPAKGLCGQYYLWWPEHHEHEWALHSNHFECVPDIDFIKVGCLWPDPIELQEGSDIPADAPQQLGEQAIDEPDLPTVPESDEHVVRVPTEIVELELSGVAPLYSTPPFVANGHNCDPALVPEGAYQDKAQKAAKRKQIEDIKGSLTGKGYTVTSGYDGGTTVTGKKYDEEKFPNLVEEYKYWIDSCGNVTKETHRVIIRNINGVLKGEYIETIERSEGKTVTTREYRDKSPLGGRTTGGTKRVVTEEPGEKDKVEDYDWEKGKWVK